MERKNILNELTQAQKDKCHVFSVICGYAVLIFIHGNQGPSAFLIFIISLILKLDD